MRVSVPGSIMISGEHAVLQGLPAVAAAVHARIVVTLIPRADSRIHIYSALGECRMRIDDIRCEPPFLFVTMAIKSLFSDVAASGFDLQIDAEMDPDVGLGSSAAVTVATYAAIYGSLHGTIPDRVLLWERCVEIIRAVQGRGSGTDVAASIYGGVVYYQMSQGVVSHYNGPMPSCCLYYAGYKTSTAAVIKIVEKHRRFAPDAYSVLDQRMGDCSKRVYEAFCSGNMDQLRLALTDGQRVMEEYGVSDETMADMIQVLSEDKHVQAAKISGSGLGDCVLVIPDQQEKQNFRYCRIPVLIDRFGMRKEAYA